LRIKNARDNNLQNISVDISGGECQRLKLVSELHKAGSVYVLDEPTTGLHMSDVAHLYLPPSLTSRDDRVAVTRA
jgi:excinuclease UvrABC ATPase subunit